MNNKLIGSNWNNKDATPDADIRRCKRLINNDIYLATTVLLNKDTIDLLVYNYKEAVDIMTSKQIKDFEETGILSGYLGLNWITDKNLDFKIPTGEILVISDMKEDITSENIKNLDDNRKVYMKVC